MIRVSCAISLVVAIVSVPGCVSGTGDPSETSAAGEGSTSNDDSGTSGSSTAASGGSGVTQGATSQASADEDTGGPGPTTSTSGSEGPSDNSTGEPSYTEACVDGCAVESACGNEWSSELECIHWCEDNLIEAGRFSPFCQAAWEGLHACIGTLDCPGYQDYLVGGRSCQAASFTHALECEGQF